MRRSARLEQCLAVVRSSREAAAADSEHSQQADDVIGTRAPFECEPADGLVSKTLLPENVHSLDSAKDGSFTEAEVGEFFDANGDRSGRLVSCASWIGGPVAMSCENVRCGLAGLHLR